MLYYENENVKLYLGDCNTGMQEMSQKCDALLTDPPYFRVKNEKWDKQWDDETLFLSWLGGILDTTKTVLMPNSSIWVFASPLLSNKVDHVVNERYRVLNNIRWYKEAGWHRRAKPENLRSFLKPWESIIFAEQYDDQYPAHMLSRRNGKFAPIGRYMQDEWERAGWKAGAVGKALGYDAALPVRWAEGSSIPTSDAYNKLRKILNVQENAEFLQRDYNALQKEQEEWRRPFNLSAETLNTDLWTYDPVKHYPGKHPCEKPQPMLRDMITSSTRVGATILDPFAGSGATLVAARDTGRKAIGFELNEEYCEAIAKRLDG
jgi:adenine-specific DNA-methyltransferase